MTPEEYLRSGAGDAADRATGMPTVAECMDALQLDPDQEITPTIANALMDVRDGVPPEAVAARYNLPWTDGQEPTPHQTDEAGRHRPDCWCQ